VRLYQKKKEHTYNQWLKKGISREELSKILSDMSKPGVKELGVPELTPKKKPTVYKKVYDASYLSTSLYFTKKKREILAMWFNHIRRRL
jgi:arsenate reductase-like glutaredoxin family protein